MLSVAKISSRISISATSSVVPSPRVPIIITFALKKKILEQSRPEKFDCDGLYGHLPKRGVMDTRTTTLGFGPGGIWQHRKHASLQDFTLATSTIVAFIMIISIY